jgi:hypothetical protein
LRRYSRLAQARHDFDDRVCAQRSRKNSPQFSKAWSGSKDQLVADPSARGPFDQLTKDPSSTPQDKSNTVIGPYHLLELIGEGGMGAVWLAEQKQPVRRRVVIKLIKAGMDTREVVEPRSSRYKRCEAWSADVLSTNEHSALYIFRSCQFVSERVDDITGQS